MNGLADPALLLRKSGMRRDDRLILTKPVGTGVIFAADMRHRARARWVEAALIHMTRPASPASALLIEAGATACTDVTGFGLAGHLLEMAEASGVDVELDMRSVPLLAGAEELMASGLASSLHTDNLAAGSQVAATTEIRSQALFSLLFDPQTAGGLLASLPPDGAERCLSALHAAGYAQAAIIGTVVARGQRPERIRIN